MNYDQQFQTAVAKTSHGRRPPPTGMRALPGQRAQPIALGRGAQPVVPGTAMRRGMGTASGGAGGRPMTAVSGAGFNSNKSTVPGVDPNIAAITLEPKIES